MDFAVQNNYALNGLGFCVFGCKAQKKANAAKAAAAISDKKQAETIASMKTNNADTAKLNAEVIAQKEAENKKKEMIILAVGGGTLALLAILYIAKRNRK